MWKIGDFPLLIFSEQKGKNKFYFKISVLSRAPQSFIIWIEIVIPTVCNAIAMEFLFLTITSETTL